MVYARRREYPWTHGLEWYPQMVRPGDFAYFDVVIVNATEKLHRSIALDTTLSPVTRQGRWRLYRVPAARAR